MKTRILGLLVCLIPALSCQRPDMLTINGKVNNNELIGSTVYVVNVEGSKEVAEDSAIIKKSSFRLKLSPDTLKIRTLRIFQHGSVKTEDLIFIKEPGTLNAVMGTRSTSSGTRLNKILMDWKKGNAEYDSTQYDLYYKTGVPGISPSVRDSLIKVSALTDSLYLKKVTDILDRNTDNAIGILLFGIYYDHLSLDTKKRILDLKGKEYMERDLYIWSKVMFDQQIPKQSPSVN
jgi:hypothetical protein